MTEPTETTEQIEPRETGRFAALVGRDIKPPSSIPREARPYQGHRAGLVTRFAADALDFVVLLVILAVLYVGYATFLFLIDPRNFSFPTVTLGAALLIGGAVLIVYLTIGWWLTGRTYGKHVMGLRVVNIAGRRMHLVGAFLRAAFCVVFPMGLFWVLISRANRSVQDVALRTSVVYDWSPHRDRAAGVADDTD